MMGERRVAQEPLFYEFNLDRHVPADHLRSIDRFVDLSGCASSCGPTIARWADPTVIVDVEASTAVRQAEVIAAMRMIERTHDDLGLWPRKLIADTGYGAADMLAWLVHERNIEPHIPVFDKSERVDGTFSRREFAYDISRDVYTCPGGKLLKRRHRRHEDRPE